MRVQLWKRAESSERINMTVKPETNVLERFVLFVGRVIVPAGLFIACASYAYTKELWLPAAAGATMAILIGYAVVALMRWKNTKKEG